MKTSVNSLSRISIVLTVAIIYLSGSFVMAQRATGIYLTTDDFMNNKLSYTNFENRRCKIRLRDISFKLPIKITCGDSTLRLKKDSIYGYKDCEGGLHRLFSKQVYTIVSLDSNIQLYRVMTSGKTKYETPSYDYYFSRTPASPVYLLSFRNIERIYVDNNKFCEFIEMHFSADTELLEYDDWHKTYKINRLLELSLNYK